MRIKISVGEQYKDPDLTQFLTEDENREHEIVLNEPVEHADAWFILEGTRPDDKTCMVPSNKLFFLGAETARPMGFYYENPGWLGYLEQFTKIYSPQELYWPNAFLTAPFLPWMVNANHGPDLFSTSERNLDFLESLDAIPKTKTISVFCSTQGLTPEHRSRLRFVEAIKDHFGDELDWFGNGVNSVDQKWDGLAPYKYSIVLENQSTPYILTEKIQDAFLALAMPVYWGAPEAPDFFDPESLIPIDIKDLRGSISKIEKLLEDDPYERVLPSLRASRSVVTKEMNFLRRIIGIVDQNSADAPEPKSRITINPIKHFAPWSTALNLLQGPVDALFNAMNQQLLRK
jgi:hypothetical protein